MTKIVCERGETTDGREEGGKKDGEFMGSRGGQLKENTNKQHRNM